MSMHTDTRFIIKQGPGILFQMSQTQYIFFVSNLIIEISKSLRIQTIQTSIVIRCKYKNTRLGCILTGNHQTRNSNQTHNCHSTNIHSSLYIVISSTTQSLSSQTTCQYNLMSPVIQMLISSL